MNTSLDNILENYCIKKIVDEKNRSVILVWRVTYDTGLIKKVSNKLNINPKSKLSKTIVAATIDSLFKIFNGKITVVAKCHPSDKFNEETGTRVAFQKLLRVIRKQVIKVIIKLYNDTHSIISKLKQKGYF